MNPLRARPASRISNGKAKSSPGILLIAGALAVTASGSSVALAQDRTQSSAYPQAAPALTPFHIPAGSLSDALQAFQSESGLSVRVTIPQNSLPNLQTQGVAGTLSPADALRQLLAGTGLNWRFAGAVTVEIGLGTSTDVSVSALQSLPLTQFTEAILDTPQSITVVPQFVMKDQGVTTLRDTLRNVPGISLAAGEGGAQGDSLTIRGFTARNDIFLDGIRDFGSYYRDSFDYEQVEVLEGPAGIEFGRGSTGGVINQETKQPHDDKNFLAGTLQLGTDWTRRVTMDGNRRLGTLGNTNPVDFRLNIEGEEANIAGRDVVENKRFGVAPSLAYGLGTPTRATLSWEHLGENDIPDYGIPWLLNKPAPSQRNAYYGFRHSNFLNTHDDIVTAKLEHDSNEHLSLRSLSRFAAYPRNAQITEPQVCSNGAISTVPGSYGQLLAPTSSVNPSQLCPYGNGFTGGPAAIQVLRNEITATSVESDLWQQDQAVLHFTRFRVPQSVVVGIEGGRETSDPSRFLFSGVPTATLIHPNEDLPFTGTKALNTATHLTSYTGSAFLMDTAHFGRYIELVGGVRFDYFNTQQQQYTAATRLTVAAHRIDHVPAYRAAFVVKPTQNGNVYFDYGTSFDPSAEALSLSVSTSVLPPEKNETYEVGSKWDFLQSRLSLAGSLFRTVKDNAKETSPANALVTVLAGNQRVKGAQLAVTGRLPNHLDVLAGYAYLDGKVIASQFFPNAIGAPLANVPKQTFNAWLTHPLAWRFSGGFGSNYVASRSASSTIPYVATAFTGTTPANAVVTESALKQVPGYWVFNTEVHRSITEKIELQANVYNLLNRFYIDEPHPSHLVPGAGRSALFGFNYSF